MLYQGKKHFSFLDRLAPVVAVGSWNASYFGNITKFNKHEAGNACYDIDESDVGWKFAFKNYSGH